MMYECRQFSIIGSVLLLAPLICICTNAFIIQSTSVPIHRNLYIDLLIDANHNTLLTRQRLDIHKDIRNDKTRLCTASSSQIQLEELCEEFMNTFNSKEITKTCKVKIGPVQQVHDDGSSSNDDNGKQQQQQQRQRLGLIATEKLSKGEVALSIPYDDKYELRADIAKSNIIFGQYITDGYDAWTGDVGYIALMVLNELALATTSSTSSSSVGIPIPNRSQSITDFMKSWINLLPSPKELKHHPLLWNEDDQEVLQSSTTNKIYKKLDDIEDDITWLIDNVFNNNRDKFPETVLWNNQQINCFNLDGFRWANAIASSRSFFLDGKLRLIPILDMCNHSDDCTEEIQDGKFGPFFTIKGAQLISSTVVKPGEEICCSYGPKSAADYLLEHGFIPDSCWTNAVCEVSIELDDTDRFYEDKLDILEYETYDQVPMDPVQKFDIVCTTNRDGEPDPAMIQFLRLCKLRGTDAFLLESIFRKEVWDFMSMPVSEQNELLVLNEIVSICEDIINNDFNQALPGGPEICIRLRELETKALARTISYIQREKQAVDLKEYYQERRLKDLGLDSAWNSDDDNDDMDSPSFGQTRRPGGADYDW
jgi:[ribulose-bisphosphate carboxylase]/[fructose-bisphosphate aldolase]-lysine N-methyltransferase